MMIRSVVLLATIFVAFIELQAQNVTLEGINTLQEFVSKTKKGSWEEVKNKKGISINYRDLVVSETIETRELSVRFNIKYSSIDSLIAHIKMPKHVRNWNDAVREISLLINNKRSWISHTVYDIPFPFKQQDLVTYSTLNKDGDVIILSSKSIPNYIQPKKGVHREGYNLSEWRLTTSNNEVVEVEFCAISLTNSSIPRFLKDPIIQRNLINSFINLKQGLL
ncbi:hypothetical protein [Urechidicola vernalis]|uniref:START domain-containing protein n=1 Tax=Urechidicola vernalis TaxID=3075600 RepID=A0ABU2Y1B5_9FLAO|nr:hypothetical protein [Urechidicola sp. P050]MDT0551994.1 hypothetical protein [Urechidicola sp. P050]